VPGLILGRNTDFGRGFSFTSSVTSAKFQDIATRKRRFLPYTFYVLFPIYSVVDVGSKVNQKKNRVKCAEMVLGKE
jgi:hypothetical protein